MGRLFGTDGVRGVANKDLTNENRSCCRCCFIKRG